MQHACSTDLVSQRKEDKVRLDFICRYKQASVHTEAILGAYLLYDIVPTQYLHSGTFKIYS